MVQRFITGAAIGAVLTAAFGYAAVSFGMTSVGGVVIAAFVGVVSGVSCMIGGVK